MFESEDLLQLVSLMEETGKTSQSCIFSVGSDVKCHLLHFNDHNHFRHDCDDAPILKPYIQDDSVAFHFTHFSSCTVSPTSTSCTLAIITFNAAFCEGCNGPFLTPKCPRQTIGYYVAPSA